MRVCIVGRGKVGRALAAALAAAGVERELVKGRFTRLPVRQRELVLLAVPDGSIAAVAAKLSGQLTARTVVLHLAGARSTHPLSSLQAQGIAVGVCHPLLSFAGTRATPNFVDATFTAFGDPRAIRAARRLAKLLSARVVVLEAAPGPAYHAAAALVANGAAALTLLGVEALREVGFGQRAAERALSSLLASVAGNVAALGVPAALTGPVARGDADTLAAHLGALERLDRRLARRYAELQPSIIDAALAQGLAPNVARALRRVVAASLDASPAPSLPRRATRRAGPKKPRPTDARRTQVTR